MQFDLKIKLRAKVKGLQSCQLAWSSSTSAILF